MPPPPGAQSPALWGIETHLARMFGEQAASIVVTPRLFTFRYRSAAHFIDVLRKWYGPVHKAFASLPESQAAALEADLTDLLNHSNRPGCQSLAVASEYLEVVVRRR